MIWVLSFMYNSASWVCIIFPEERPALLKEQGTGMYHIFPYFLSKVICEFPLIVLYVTIYDLLVYFILGYNTTDPSHFFTFYFFGILFVFGCSGFGFMIGALVSDSMIGLEVLLIVMTPLMLLSGFFCNPDNATPLVKPLEYLSMFKYTTLSKI